MRAPVGAIAIATALNMAAWANAAELRLYPIQTGAETVRFLTGVPTLNLETAEGAVQITPLPFDHGHVTFGLGIYNKGGSSGNFGIENIQATINGVAVRVLSSAELQKRAKSRAAWSQVGIALLAGAAAAASASAYTTQTSNGYLSTPHGSYSWVSSYRDNTLGVLGATAATAGGVAGVVGIQQRLDYTLANLAHDIVQTTTIDPNASYGGRIVIEKPVKATAPYDVVTVITWNGAQYPFAFRVTKEGVNMPPPYSSPTISPAVLQTPRAPAGQLQMGAPAVSSPTGGHR